MIYTKNITKKFRKYVDYTENDDFDAQNNHFKHNINKITWCLNNHKWEEIDLNMIISCGGCNTTLKLNKENMLYYYIILYCLIQKSQKDFFQAHKNINKLELSNIELKLRRLLDNNNKDFNNLLIMMKLYEFNHKNILNKYIDYLLDEGYYNV